MKKTPAKKTMSRESRSTAHVDTFCAQNLPPVELRPRIEMGGLKYPAQLNAASELLNGAARKNAKATAIHSHDGNWTYARLLEMSNRIAHVLVDDLGMVPGNRVLLRGPNHPMMVACWFAVLKAGGVAVCTMPLLRKKEMAYTAEKAQIDIALCDQRFAAECGQAFATRRKSQVLFFNREGNREGKLAEKDLEVRAARKPAKFSDVCTGAEDIALIAFTSGTTGVSKGTMHSHRDLLACADTFAHHIVRAGARDVFIGSPPLAFTYGLGGLLLFPFRVGASVVLLEQGMPQLLLEGIQHFRATVCFTAPTAYRAMLKLLEEFDISSLKKCISAGETLPVETFHAWEKATGLKIIDGIGSTEMLHIFISAAGDDIRPGATGKVVPGYRAKLLDPAGGDTPIGEVGHLAVIGPTGCRYLNDREQQKKYVRNGWNVTGDSYKQDADGYFWYQARTDDMIVSSGYNISAPEVENVLLGNAKVAECAVIGVPDPERGQLVKAFVVLAPGGEPTPGTAKDLQEFVKQEIAPYKYPRAIEFVKSLPRTNTGKLQRGRLREQIASATATAVQFHEPESWPRPKGYANATSARGRTIFLAGQVGWEPKTAAFASDDFAPQLRQALLNMTVVLRAAGAEPRHIVRLTWYVTDRKAYLNSQPEIGEVYREVMGKHFPAMTVVEVSALIEERAVVEIEATAMVPEPPAP
ncbi:MAG: AMP-binding protein [Terriglobales bacterium]